MKIKKAIPFTLFFILVVLANKQKLMAKNFFDKSNNFLDNKHIKNLTKSNEFAPKFSQKFKTELSFKPNNDSISLAFKNKFDRSNYFDKYRISANAIYAYRYGLTYYGLSEIEKKLVDKIKHNIGFYFDGHMAVSKSRRFFVGFQYSNVQGNASENNAVLVTNNFIAYFGTAELQVNIETYGINTLYRLKTKNEQNKFFLTLGLNKADYYEDFRISNYNVVTKGTTWATTVGIKYDKKISNNFGLGFGATIDGGLVSSLKINQNGIENVINFSNGEGIGLGRFMFSVGARYYIQAKKL
jgi:hypothetical protein